YATGWALMVALTFAISTIFAQVTVSDFLLARYTVPKWRGRLYALRFFLIFAPAGLSAWSISRFYDKGGVDLILFVTMALAALFAILVILISLIAARVENRRAREMLQPAE
ncbi:MAG: hypothetical protein AB7K04_15805, partial [Pseudorhodoplanes sp.]